MPFFNSMQLEFRNISKIIFCDCRYQCTRNRKLGAI